MPDEPRGVLRRARPGRPVQPTLPVLPRDDRPGKRVSERCLPGPCSAAGPPATTRRMAVSPPSAAWSLFVFFLSPFIGILALALNAAFIHVGVRLFAERPRRNRRDGTQPLLRRRAAGADPRPVRRLARGARIWGLVLSVIADSEDARHHRGPQPRRGPDTADRVLVHDRDDPRPAGRVLRDRRSGAAR